MTTGRDSNGNQKSIKTRQQQEQHATDEKKHQKLDDNNNMILNAEEVHTTAFSDDNSDDEMCSLPDMYHNYKFGDNIPRSGKVFSYTFWRTKCNSDVFWSVQGNSEMDGNLGGIWIATEYFGSPEFGARYVQEVTLTHPTEWKIQMRYSSTLEEGRNCVFISKSIVHHFRNDDNSIDFEFRITRVKKRRRNRRRKNS